MIDGLNACLDELMHGMGEERAQQLATEETLQQTQARLNTMAGQQNAPAQPNSAPAPASNPMVIAKPQSFDGTRGTAGEVFIGKIGLYAVTYPKRFPTNATKVVFTVSFMRDYTATWSQPYLEKVFKGDPVVFDYSLNDFRFSFFDHNRRHCSEVTLWNLRQTGTIVERKTVS
ncbi:uncharacterized protein VP01_9842g1, partial [Puccinia sorghi]